MTTEQPAATKDRTARQYEADLRREAVARYAHHAIVSRGEGRWTLRAKGSSALWCEVVALAGGALMVHGDGALCAWERFSGGSSDAHALVAWIGAHGDDLEYVARKASMAFDGDSRLTKERHAEVLRRELADMRADWEKSHGRPPSEDVLAELEGAFNETYGDPDPRHCDSIVDQLVQADVIDGEEASGLGEVITRRVIFGWAAVNRLHTLLCAEKAATSS